MAIGAIAVGWVAGGYQAKALDQHMRAALIQRAERIAGGVNPGFVGRLTFTSADRGTPADEFVRTSLKSSAHMGDVRGVFSVQRRGGRYFFGPETYPAGDPMASAPGDEYRRPPPALVQVFTRRRTRVVGPYTDEFGSFVSVFAPVRASGGNAVIAVLGIDVLATEWESRLAAERWSPIRNAGGPLCLLLLSAAAAWRYRRLGNARPRLRRWVMAPTLAAVLVTLAAYARNVTMRFDADAAADVAAFAEHAEDVWVRGIAGNTLLLRAHTDDILQDAALTGALDRRDLPAIRSRSAFLLDRLRAAYGASDLSLYDASGVALWGGHGSAHRGDGIGCVSLVAAQRTREDAWGVEPGAEGLITLRVVRPFSLHGRLAGFLEVGMPLDGALDHLAKDVQEDLLIAVRKQPLTRPELALVQQAVGAGQVWHDYRNAGVIGPAGLMMPRELAAWYGSRGSSDAPMPGMQIRVGRRYVVCSSIPVQDGAGRIAADLIVMRDVTDQTYGAAASLISGLAMAVLLFGTVFFLLWAVTGQAEDRLDAVIADLTASESRIRAITNSAQDAIMMIDANGLISYWNPAAESTLGYTAEEALGQNLHNLFCPERTRAAAAAAHGAFVLTGTGPVVGQTREMTAIRKDGVEISVRLSLSAVRMDDAWHAVGIVTDITERIRAEQRIAEANAQLARAAEEARALTEQANAANQAKSEFLASMSHEIRTPMNGVIGMTGLLLDTELTPDQRQYAQIVRSSGDSLLALINDILDFSKIEARKLELEPIEFDLRTAMEDAAEVVAVKAQQKGLELVCMVDCDLPALVRGDAGRLRQVAVNLCSNAVKFTSAGSVTLRAAKESETDTDITVRFTVADTGIGIPPEKHAHIFGAFNQADQSTTRNFGGTGLGLAISRHLAELMGGAIGVESVVGSGSTFWFTVVLGRASITGDNGSEPGTALQGVRVLVVDDNAVNRLLVGTLLETWGCDHAEAEDGAAALHILRRAADARRPFQLAILDVHMPGMGGEELAAVIKADPELQGTLLVMLTSLAGLAVAQRLATTGVARCLSKPVRQAALRSCLAEMMTASRSAAQSGASEPTHAEQQPTGRILVAEDNPTNQMVALMILRKLGYRADAVANGLEALAALGTTPYDLVMMDCQMPEMDGFEAAQHVRDAASDVLNHSVPIVAMTAGAMRGDRDACLQAGMNDYITKPVRPVELSAVVRRWLVTRSDGPAQTE